MSEIDELRKKMETITLEMIKLLEARTDIAEKIGKIKNDLGISVTDESREVELREKIIAECKTLKLDENIGTRFLNFLLNEYEFENIHWDYHSCDLFIIILWNSSWGLRIFSV